MRTTYENIPELMRYRASVHGDRPALYFEGRFWSYKELESASLSAFHSLDSHHVGKGQRFSVLDYNSPESLFLFLGAALYGAVPVMINWRLTLSEIEFILKDSGSTLLFLGKDFEEYNISLKERMPELKISEISSVLRADTNISEFPIPPKREDVVVQLYTSGTTGFPKGVLLTHENLLETLRNLALELPGFGSDSRNLVCGPFYHIAGVGYTMLGFIPGGTNYLTKKFDSSEVMHLLQSQRITNALLVPAMIQAIVSHPESAKFDYSYLRNIQYGGSGISEEVLFKAVELFDCGFTQAYGLTETTGIATLLRYDDHIRILENAKDPVWKERRKSSGRPVPGMRARIVGKNEQILQNGEIGEIQLKGVNVGLGYWNRPKENSETLGDDGWFKTGDLGSMDEEGYIYILDRKKDMIVSKAENLYPAEIERELFGYPKASDLAVFGLPDPEYGEAVSVAMVPKQGEDASLEDLCEWAKGRLAGFKMPRRFFIVDSLPRNPSGKVLRRELRSRFSEESVEV